MFRLQNETFKELWKFFVFVEKNFDCPSSNIAVTFGITVARRFHYLGRAEPAPCGGSSSSSTLRLGEVNRFGMRLKTTISKKIRGRKLFVSPCFTAKVCKSHKRTVLLSLFYQPNKSGKNVPPQDLVKNISLLWICTFLRLSGHWSKVRRKDTSMIWVKIVKLLHPVR